jgi:sporulation protein YlmC with PRC-barrel domain
MKKPLLACLLVVGLGAAAEAQDQRPAVPEGMSTGNSERLPGGFTAAEGADQILLRNIVGQPLYGRGGDRLGTIEDALVRRDGNTLDLVILDTGIGGSSAKRPLAWSSIDARDRKHLTADLGRDDIKNTTSDSGGGSTVDQAKKSQDYASVAHQLLGRKVVDRDGKSLGGVHDLVMDAKDAHLVAALIGSGIGIGISGSPRAVPWSAVKPPADDKQPVAVALGKEEFERQPAFVSQAPAAPEKSAPVSGSSSDPRTGVGKTGKEETLDLGGKSVVPPSATRRSQ